jgi:hypothetical protein
MQEIAVCGMKFEKVDADPLGPQSGIHVRLLDFAEASFIQRR